MKNVSLTIAAALFLLFFTTGKTIGQNTEGIVTFTETVKMKIEVPEGMDTEEFKKMMPSEQKAAKTLTFNEKASIFTDAPEQKQGDTDVTMKSEDNDGGEMQVNMVIKRPESHQYRDLEGGKKVESTEFFGRFFLISEDAKRMKWKLGVEQKKILGYLCQKAVLQDTSRKVEAWFTPQIPVAIGPAEFGDLPGIILEVSLGEDRTWVAEKVEMKPLEKGAIEKPTKGKAISREEYTKIRDEKLKEMGATPGGGGMKIIIKN